MKGRNKKMIIAVFISAAFFHSCTKEYTSLTYEFGDELVCIAKDGAKLRFTPEVTSDYYGTLKFNESVTFLSVEKEDGTSRTKVNRTEEYEYWLKVSYEDEVLYVHGAAVVFSRSRQANFTPRIPDEDPEPEIPQEYTDEVSLYLALADVKVRTDRSTGSREITMVKEGELISSGISTKGQQIDGCYAKSNFWIKVEDGWSSGVFYHRFNKIEVDAIKEKINEFTGVDDAKSFICRKESPIRMDRNTVSAAIGYLEEGAFVLSDQGLVGDEISYCDAKNDRWIKIGDGWLNSIHLTEISRPNLEFVISYFDF